MISPSQNNNDELSIPSKAEFEELEKDVRFYKTRNGARIAFHEYGDPAGHPIIFYHGTGSHVQGMCLHKPGIRYGFRIIVPDRPGIGQSDFRPNWTVLEYSRDIAELANHLGIESFGAIGISGAGPTLMATAFTNPHKLKCVVELACAMPLYRDKKAIRHLGSADRLYAILGTRLPLSAFRLPFSIIGLTMKILKKPRLFAKMFKSSLCASDQAIFALPDFQYFLMKDFQSLFSHGSKAAAYDAQTVYKDWGFNIADIHIHIEGFHGTDDKFIPIKFSEYMTKTIKKSHLNSIQNQGHFYHLVYGYQMLKKVKDLFYTKGC